MTVKYKTNDDKYEQYHYMETDATTAATFTNTANWQGVDETPTTGSQNLVKSCGILSDIQSRELDFTGVVPVDWFVTSGIPFYYSDGSKSVNVARRRTNYIKVKEGDKFAYTLSNTSNTLIIAAFNNGVLDLTHSVVGAGANASATYTVPAGITHIQFCNNNNNTPVITKTNLAYLDNIPTANSGNFVKSSGVYNADLSIAAELVDCGKILNIEGKYVKTDGSLVSLSGYSCTPHIEVKRGDSFFVNLQGSGSACRPYVILESDKTTIVSVGGYNDTVNKLLSGKVSIDADNAAYIVFCNYDAFTNAYIKKYSLIDKFNENSVNELNNVILPLRNNFAKINFVSDFYINEINATKCEIYRDDCELYLDNNYISVSNGVVINHAENTYKTYKFNVPSGVFSIKPLGTLNNKGAVVYTDDTAETIKNGSAEITHYFNLNKTAKYLLLNWSVETDVPTNPYLDYFYPSKAHYVADGKEFLDTSDIKHTNGYIKNDGVLVTQSSVSQQYVSKIIYDENYDYYFEGTAGGVLGCAYDVNDNFLDAISNYIVSNSNSTKSLLFPIGTHYLLINCIGTAASASWYRKPKKEPYTRIHDYVEKPIDFTNKSAVFFGDSITQGIASVPGGSNFNTQNGWPKLLSDKLGITFTNKGRGGSTLTYDSIYNVKSGVDLICGSVDDRYDVVEDMIFIAYGANDYGLSRVLGKVTDTPQVYTEATTFFGALNFIANYLKTTYPNKPVFFVLPIWRNESKGMLYKLDAYRQAICDVAFRNKFNVINGKEFGFECGSDTLIADSLHPTELGYQLYANQVYNRLV